MSMGFSHIHDPDGLSNTLLSEGCVLENGPHHGNNGESVYSKHGGRGQEALIAQVQLTGQPAITPSQ